MDSDFLAPLKTLVKSLGAKQTATLVLAFAAVVAVVGGSAYWMSEPTYALLASDLDAESASALTSQLKNAKVPYQLTDGGRSIRVQAERVDEMRLQIAGSGLPSGGRIGFEIFDRPAFGTTEFLEQVNFRRALEGELGRTITTLSDIASARVHIAMAKDSLFSEKAESAKASVVLKLKNNRPLAPSTVKAITGLVASSVESLRPESVVVLDTYGRSLTRAEDAGDDANSAVGLDRQQRIERDTAAHVVALLEPVVGVGHVRVNVAARLKSDAEDVTEVKFDPTGVVRSKQTITESDTRSNPQGAAGARANMPAPASTSNAAASQAAGAAGAAAPGAAPAGAPPAGATAAGTAAAIMAAVTPPGTSPASPTPNPPGFLGAPTTTMSGTQRSSDTTNFEVGQLTTHRTSPSGQVARLSVAVILDDERAAVKPGETAVAKPRTPEELQRIHKLVASAVGFDESRGDQLTVDSIAFDTPAEPEASPAPSGFAGFADDAKKMVLTNGMSALRLVGTLGLASLAIFGFLRPMARRALALPKPPAALPAAAGARPPTVAELEGRYTGGDSDTSGGDEKRPLLARRVAKLASEEPEYVARIMRTWLAEEER
jgi:flagellar M-ring protein FliF